MKDGPVLSCVRFLGSSRELRISRQPIDPKCKTWFAWIRDGRATPAPRSRGRYSIRAERPDTWRRSHSPVDLRRGRRPRRDRGLWPLVEFLENRQLLSGSGPFQFEFGTSRSPLDPGFIRIAATPYNARHGYGWTGKGGITAKDLGRRADPATRHFNAGRDKTFLLNLSNGIYDVSPTLGNAKGSLKGLSLWINGTLVAAGLGTAPGHHLQPTFRVAIGSGQLRLRIASSGARSSFAIDALQVELASPPSVDAGSPLSGAVGQAVSFQATASAARAPGIPLGVRRRRHRPMARSSPPTFMQPPGPTSRPSRLRTDTD